MVLGPPFLLRSPGISFVDTYSVNSRSFRPITDAGGLPGELMVVIAMGGDTGPGGVPGLYSSITGWTELWGRQLDGGRDANYSAGGTSGWARRLDGSETSDVNFIQGGTTFYHSRALRFSGVSSFSVGTEQSTSSISNPSARTLSMSGLTKPAIALGVYFGVEESPDPPYSTVEFDEAGGAQNVQDASYVDSTGDIGWDIRYKIYNSGWDDVIFDAGDEEEVNILAGNYILST